MESFAATQFLVEKEESYSRETLLETTSVQRQPLALETQPVAIQTQPTVIQTQPTAIDSLMKEKAELFLALIDKVNEPATSYINQHSWLFGRNGRQIIQFD